MTNEFKFTDKPFARMQYYTCGRGGCTAVATFRIGKIDACGRHVGQAIEFQCREGEIWEKECFIARYYR